MTLPCVTELPLILEGIGISPLRGPFRCIKGGYNTAWAKTLNFL